VSLEIIAQYLITSIVCKLLERNIKNKIIRHQKSHYLLTFSQYVFSENRSTILQFLNVLEDWTKALDDGKQVDTINFDFAKAFDTACAS